MLNYNSGLSMLKVILNQTVATIGEWKNSYASYSGKSSSKSNSNNNYCYKWNIIRIQLLSLLA